LTDETPKPETAADDTPGADPAPPPKGKHDFDVIAEEALQTAMDAAQALEAEVAAAAEPQAVKLPTFDERGSSEDDTHDLSMLNDVDLHVKVELGRTRMFVEDVLRLDRDSVVELDKTVGDPVDVFVNGRLVARGEVLVLDDNFCVRVSEIVSRGEAGG
jgi:flagellar motor switch protein FliN/FliY